jgi:hypothetical protein
MERKTVPFRATILLFITWGNGIGWKDDPFQSPCGWAAGHLPPVAKTLLWPWKEKYFCSFLLVWTRLHLLYSQVWVWVTTFLATCLYNSTNPQPTHLNPADGGIMFLWHSGVSLQDYSVTNLKAMRWTSTSKLDFTNAVIWEYYTSENCFLDMAQFTTLPSIIITSFI